jgi:hypothetical protein
MSKAEGYKVSVGTTLKLYLPSVPGSGGFKPGDLMATLNVEGEFPGDVGVAEARKDMEDYFQGMVSFIVVQVPRIVDNGVTQLNRSSPVVDTGGGGRINGSLSLGTGGAGSGTPGQSGNVQKTGQEKSAPASGQTNPVKDASKDADKGRVNLQPAGQGSGSGNALGNSVKQNQDAVDPALLKVRKVFEKMSKEKPFSNLVFADPTDAQSAYVDIRKWLDSDGQESPIVRHWNDVYFLTNEVRKISRQRERDKAGAGGRSIISFDDWKDVMEYLYAHNWVTKSGDNHYEPIPH